MNNVVLSGRIIEKGQYTKESKKMKVKSMYKFILLVGNPKTGVVEKIPIKCYGSIADEANARFLYNCKVEVVGFLSKVGMYDTIYVEATQIYYTLPRGKTTYVMSSEELKELYNPKKVLSKLNLGNIRNYGYKTEDE